MMRVSKGTLCAALVFGLVTMLCAAGAEDGGWLSKVPPKHRLRSNPFAGNAAAVKAGARLYEENCAQCHGSDGQGKKGPNLHSDRIDHATPGELEWLLTNGSLKNGMPSWSRLPEPQRWQIVTYLKSWQGTSSTALQDGRD